MVNRLKTRYKSIFDVEYFLAGILENHAKGSLLGPLFQRICAEQFCRTQKGSIFYYESNQQPYPFTLGMFKIRYIWHFTINFNKHNFILEQLKQIRKVTLSLVYCYTTNLQFIQPDAFRLISEE